MLFDLAFSIWVGQACQLKRSAVRKELLFIEGSLETKVPTIWTNEKQSQEEAEPGRNSDV